MIVLIPNPFREPEPRTVKEKEIREEVHCINGIEGQFSSAEGLRRFYFAAYLQPTVHELLPGTSRYLIGWKIGSFELPVINAQPYGNEGVGIRMCLGVVGG